MRYPFLDLGKANAPYIEDLVKAATRVIDSGRYIGGDEVATLESHLSEYLDAPYIIGVSNGLDALRLILKAYVELGRLAPGDEVIYPANTYVASVLAISDAGLKPVPVDIDEDTLNLDFNLIEASISPLTRAIMPVHLYGRITWGNALKDIAQRHGLLIIEDCAQALGAQSSVKGLYNSCMAGALGDAGALSFYPTKNVGALGDAGAVVTHDPDLARTVRALANYGSDRRYHNIYLGYNCRLDPIQAAMLCIKLDHIDRENESRRHRAKIYNDNITNPRIILPAMAAVPSEAVWHQYVVRVKEGQRDNFRRQLDNMGVGTDIHYATPPHRQPCYKSLADYNLPVTDRVADQLVSLPIATGTSDNDIHEIAHIINQLSL